MQLFPFNQYLTPNAYHMLSKVRTVQFYKQLGTFDLAFPMGPPHTRTAPAMSRPSNMAGIK